MVEFPECSVSQVADAFPVIRHHFLDHFFCLCRDLIWVIFVPEPSYCWFQFQFLGYQTAAVFLRNQIFYLFEVLIKSNSFWIYRLWYFLKKPLKLHIKRIDFALLKLTLKNLKEEEEDPKWKTHLDKKPKRVVRVFKIFLGYFLIIAPT